MSPQGMRVMMRCTSRKQENLPCIVSDTRALQTSASAMYLPILTARCHCGSWHFNLWIPVNWASLPSYPDVQSIAGIGCSGN